jgi:hypothetical protein
MACSKRRQKTNNIVSKKENTDDNVTIAEVSNGLVKNYIHTIISPELESVSCSENNDLIVSLEDESSEREKDELKKHKTLLNTSEMDDFTSNTCNENEDHRTILLVFCLRLEHAIVVASNCFPFCFIWLRLNNKSIEFFDYEMFKLSILQYKTNDIFSLNPRTLIIIPRPLFLNI